MGNPVKLQVSVSSVEKFGEGVYLVALKPEGRLPRYKSGQFLHLALDAYDPAGGFWPESRVFSIASRQGDEDLVIVYSVKGSYTQRMARELAVGRSLWVKLPFGEFTIASKMLPGDEAVLVAGGTGISPFIPFLLEGADFGKPRMYYGVREPELMLFRPLLSQSVAEGRLDLRLWIENAARVEEAAALGFVAVGGRFDVGRIAEECASLAKARYFLSGPPKMIEVFKKGLSDRGVGPDRIHSDDWE